MRKVASLWRSMSIRVSPFRPMMRAQSPWGTQILFGASSSPLLRRLFSLDDLDAARLRRFLRFGREGLLLRDLLAEREREGTRCLLLELL
mmetsp:Transcript_12797/g.28870  ORF Transcript_12797/g.28870 Transcript_12797/m.28870 type:complete len:90 (+) Transcript_12797:1251-1520(+)